METRQCTLCKQVVPKHYDRWNDTRQICRTCYVRQWRRRHRLEPGVKDREREIQNAWNAKNRQRYRATQKKSHRKWYYADPERTRAVMRERQNRYLAKKRLDPAWREHQRKRHAALRARRRADPQKMAELNMKRRIAYAKKKARHDGDGPVPPLPPHDQPT